jgi:predicted MFS family arabinose efflux permease
MRETVSKERFFGWSVAWAAFVIAVFAWGIGFYGPSVFLQTLHDTQGWSISQISTAISAHYLTSAVVIAYLPEIHRKFGVSITTFVGALFTAIGLAAWSGAWEPWHLFAAAVPSSAGWAMTSGAAINAIVSKWFDRDRPKAIGLAFNGASVGGILFVPLWVYLIGHFGFQAAALTVAGVTVVTIGFLSEKYLRASPDSLGVSPDGEISKQSTSRPKPSLSRLEILRTPKFITMSVAFSLGLFAQIGLVSHLIVRLTPEVGVTGAGMLVSLATVCAVVGRTLLGWWIGDQDRRLALALNLMVQLLGVLLLMFGGAWPALALGCVFFGLGMGNLTSMSPLIAQAEFDRQDAITVVALIIAINQAVFAFAPAIIGAIRDATSDYFLPFAVLACVQLLSAIIILVGRGAARPPQTSV